MMASRPDEDDLGGWLAANGFTLAEGPGAIADVSRVRSLLIAAARDGRALTYGECLAALGHRFTRPKMRALCCALDTIDEAGARVGQPDLAVLVVRQSDRLPGQGWWIGNAEKAGYTGPWTGPDAMTFVRHRQAAAYRYRWEDAER
jgi:hypothetical protein